MKAYAIVVAGGEGRRFGGPKQFELLRGKPILQYSLEIFESCPSIAGVCLVVPEERLQDARALIPKTCKKTRWILSGGAERQHSVACGFRALPVCDAVLVHDGVRPFFTRELAEKIAAGLKEHEGIIPALPLRETIKEVDENQIITRTLDRSSLWAAQTPQGFRYSTLKAALAKADSEKFVGTDEAALVERLGIPLRIIKGDSFNLKITTREDLVWAERFLREGS